MKYAAFSGALMDYSIHDAIATAARLGFDGIEIACREPHLSPDTPLRRVREIKELADDKALSVPVLAGYMGKFSENGDKDCEAAYEEFRRLLEHADVLGADGVRLFQGGPNAFLAEDYHYEKAAFWLRKCAGEARKHGKRVLLEIHNNSLVETPASALRLLKLVQDDNIGLIHDAGNMYITDTEFGRESVQQLGRYLSHVHVKDELRIKEAGAPGTFTNRTHHGEEHFLQCRLGEGGVDHRELFAALMESGYRGWITLECFAPFPPEEQLAHDLQVVKDWMNLGGSR
ncbi:sugar phosphate isomerase/epimerase family protein [Paenibacillus nasutitermitis]|uniref:Xylose isomerase-like TIM barrel domain-containing protein n=1 Tax=Paenibacillus nasutitermitis TaxID=1652958 RepID=A0A917DN86_9BACL|nr:sugar phosphate isomerase/epimerase family protein [Paenibacillus nasutitermitis]GGD50226.1 hypothetical protein GCM10010911_04760 [Paenibacillus nasutitermitis]